MPIGGAVGNSQASAPSAYKPQQNGDFFQHVGFRQYAGVDSRVDADEAYEGDPDQAKQLAFHFEGGRGNYFERLARIAEEWCTGRDIRQVFEFGCGPGRLSLELASGALAPVFIHSTDCSADAFAATQRFIKIGRVRYAPIIEGELCEYREEHIESLTCSADGIQFFEVADAAHMDFTKFSGYDLVVAAAPCFWNRVKEPEKLLGSTLAALLVNDGLLLLGNTWPSAEAQDNAFALLSAAGMEYVGLEEDLEFTIRDTIRQTTIGLQHLSLWRKSTSIVANVAEAQGKDGMMKVAGKLGQNMYANPKVVEQYAAFHFMPGDAESYPLRCAQRCIEVVNQLGVHQGRAIEFGAGPGRAAMELAKHFESVVGSDFSQHLIDIGKVLLTEGKLRFSSGSSEIEVTPTDLQIGSVEQSRLELLRVDACAPTPPGDEASCDLVCCFNLIDRLPDPKAFLVEAARRLRPGGLLVISSPYTWLEAFTPKDKWIGGRMNGGKNIRSIDALREYLTTGDSAQFEDALAPEDIFFRFEETPRLRQETKAEMSFWRKKH